jgi:hypothetical protein
MSSAFRLYPGHHVAEFMGIEEGYSEHGPYLLWNFCVKHGRRGTFVNRATGIEPIDGSSCARMLAGVLGRAVFEGDLGFVGLYVGRSYSILVNYREDGWPQVQSVQAVSEAA